MHIDNISKELFSTLIGALLILYAFSCYMFNFPREQNMWVNLTEAGVGFVLFFIDGRVIADKIHAFLWGKINKKQ